MDLKQWYDILKEVHRDALHLEQDGSFKTGSKAYLGFGITRIRGATAGVCSGK